MPMPPSTELRNSRSLLDVGMLDFSASSVRKAMLSKEREEFFDSMRPLVASQG